MPPRDFASRQNPWGGGGNYRVTSIDFLSIRGRLVLSFTSVSYASVCRLPRESLSGKSGEKYVLDISIHPL